MFHRHIVVFIGIFLMSFSFAFVKENAFTEIKRDDPTSKNFDYKRAVNYVIKGKPDSAIIFLLKARAQFLGSGDNPALLYCLYKLAFIENVKNNLPLGLQYINSADSIIKLKKMVHPLWADISYMQGNILFRKNDFDKSYQIFEQCLLKSKTTNAPDSTIARIYARKATIEYYKGYYSSAIESFTNAGKFGSSAFGKYSLFVSDQVNNQGVINLMMARNDEALANFQQSENLMKIGKISSPAALASTYTNIGLIFKTRNDLNNALQFYNKALELNLSDPENGNSQIANTYINIAVVHQRLGHLDKQLEYLQKSMWYGEKYQAVALPKVYWLLATYYSDLADYKSAENYYAKSINKNGELFGDSPALASILNNYGEFNMYFIKDFNKSLVYYTKALPLYQKLYGEHHPSIANCLRNIGEIYFYKRDYTKALLYYQKAIIAVSETYSNSDVYSNPPLEQSLADDKFVEILKSKAKALQTIADKQTTLKEKINFQTFAFQNYLLALKTIDKIRMGYENDESRIFLSENEQDTYENAIRTGLSLYESTKRKEFLNKAFAIADQSHASSLQSAIREKEWIAKLPQSDSTLIKEFRIKRDLALYNEFILKEKISQKIDSAKLRDWKQTVNDLTLKRECLKAEIKAKNLTFYQFRYQINNSDLVNDLKRTLSKRDVVFEYYYTSKSLITFCFTSDTILYKSQLLPGNFETDISKILAFVREPKIYRADSTLCLDYRLAGWNLYQLLIQPFEKIIKGKDIIVVPDNKLMYIPFETLLTTSTISKSYNFKELPYLIKEHSIRYLYAASLLNIHKKEPSNGKMAAFVPNYNSGINTIKNNLAVLKNCGVLSNLQQTMNEAKAIATYFPGKIFSKNNASEDNFKKLAYRYSTILLAMHAVIDDENPLYSRLVFTSKSSKNEDDQLFTYETYNLNLNADLIVLSACNTGVGKLRKGEGMMSLTRGFSFAGVQSIVMTLWSVNDNSSADLMKRFYQKLSGLWNKDKALQEAKTEYIQNTDIIHAHPYFWAGYVLIGDNVPLRNSKTIPFYWVIVLPVLLGIGFGFTYFKKKRTS